MKIAHSFLLTFLCIIMCTPSYSTDLVAPYQTTASPIPNQKFAMPESSKHDECDSCMGRCILKFKDVMGYSCCDGAWCLGDCLADFWCDGTVDPDAEAIMANCVQSCSS